MKPSHKYVFFLLLLNILLIGTGYFLISIADIDLSFSDIAILSTLFSIIILITLIVFFRGQKKEPGNQTMHSLVSVSLKFLLELALALVWFIVAKKTTFSSILIFFVLYLTFTLFLVYSMLKVLKTKSL